MSTLVIDGGPGASSGVGAPGGSAAGVAAGRPGTSAGADRARPARWWQAWRARFGLAEVCGTGAAAVGFAVGYRQAGSLLAAAGLATVGEAIGFYGCIGVKTVA